MGYGDRYALKQRGYNDGLEAAAKLVEQRAKALQVGAVDYRRTAAAIRELIK